MALELFGNAGRCLGTNPENESLKHIKNPLCKSKSPLGLCQHVQTCIHLTSNLIAKNPGPENAHPIEYGPSLQAPCSATVSQHYSTLARCSQDHARSALQPSSDPLDTLEHLGNLSVTATFTSIGIAVDRLPFLKQLWRQLRRPTLLDVASKKESTQSWAQAGMGCRGKPASQLSSSKFRA